MGSHDGRSLVGLIGSGIGTSLSPALHEREGDERGLRYLYRLRDLAVLGLPPTAVAHGLASLGAARIRIFDIDRGRAERLAAQVSDRHADLAPRPVDTVAEALEGADGVINATPVGMEDTRARRFPSTCCDPTSGSPTWCTDRWTPS